jgi:hypothetical protein
MLVPSFQCRGSLARSGGCTGSRLGRGQEMATLEGHAPMLGAVSPRRRTKRLDPFQKSTLRGHNEPLATTLKAFFRSVRFRAKNAKNLKL